MWVLGTANQHHRDWSRSEFVCYSYSIVREFFEFLDLYNTQFKRSVGNSDDNSVQFTVDTFNELLSSVSQMNNFSTAAMNGKIKKFLRKHVALESPFLRFTKGTLSHRSMTLYKLDKKLMDEIKRMKSGLKSRPGWMTTQMLQDLRKNSIFNATKEEEKDEVTTDNRPLQRPLKRARRFKGTLQRMGPKSELYPAQTRIL